MGLLISLLYPLTYFLPTLYFASKTNTINVRTSAYSKETRQESLQTFVKTRCPSLLKPFIPAWWLFSGHLQVGYCVLGDFSKADKVEYDRTLLRTVDGGTIGLDFTPPKNEQMLDDDVPIVVVLHGLTGGSYESYVRAVLNPACTPKERGGLGYRGVVVNFRGCAGVPLTSPQLYSAGHTDDIRVAVYYIRKRYPRAPLIGVGFSLGANVLTRYMSEEGENCRMIAGCVLACPWDLVVNSHRIEGKWFHRTVYSAGMGQNLQGIIRQHAHRLVTFTDHPVSKAVETTLALDKPPIRLFDQYMTRLIGGSSPLFPMPTSLHYYEWASCHTVLPGIKVPFLAINDSDDPIVQCEPPYDVGGNGFVALAVTKKGGHLGWFESAGGLQAKRWVTKPIIEWLSAVGEDMVTEFRAGKPMREVDGFLKEEGRDDIGCMEIEGGGHIVGTDGEEGLLAGL
ncbi:AB-hydrolase YheT [Laetiporus sulphureus 93-53]|uniref:AB-hydrolase YheT n=1 Tax=Laetiporus sulphureus 93-53 TaxID=1314785 RepID=A0A165DPS1_9APHY|nr:AB-hydrolase YheT [Laetiporus sulphureus 93-53]KZT05357.1 AB-hydrolase YheT [Laetiporus sulphureus 93-53]